jgi:hypothetical protein
MTVSQQPCETHAAYCVDIQGYGMLKQVIHIEPLGLRDEICIYIYMYVIKSFGLHTALSSRAAPQLRRLVAGIPSLRPGFDPKSGDVRFVVNKVTLERVFSEHFGFPCQMVSVDHISDSRRP